MQAPRVAMPARICKTTIIAARPVLPGRLSLRQRLHTSNIVCMAEGAVPLHSGKGPVPPMISWRDMTKEERLAGFRTVRIVGRIARRRKCECCINAMDT